MAQPDDLAGVGDDDVGVDDGRVVLRVCTVRERSNSLLVNTLEYLL